MLWCRDIIDAPLFPCGRGPPFRLIHKTRKGSCDSFHKHARVHQQVGRFLLERILFVHCRAYRDKFNAMVVMIEKLYAFVAGECLGDNLDSQSNQEVLLGGHLYGQLLSEKLFDLLIGAKARLIKDLKNPKFD